MMLELFFFLYERSAARSSFDVLFRAFFVVCVSMTAVVALSQVQQAPRLEVVAELWMVYGNNDSGWKPSQQTEASTTSILKYYVRPWLTEIYRNPGTT